MKPRLLVTLICVLALLLSTSTPAFAAGEPDTATVVVDLAVARPVSLALTIVGSALFVVSLPFSAASGCVDKAAHALVVGPAKDAFTRPLGDLEDFLEY